MAKPLSGWETPDENGWEDTFPILKVDEPEEDEDDSMEGTAVERINRAIEAELARQGPKTPPVVSSSATGNVQQPQAWGSYMAEKEGDKELAALSKILTGQNKRWPGERGSYSHQHLQGHQVNPWGDPGTLGILPAPQYPLENVRCHPKPWEDFVNENLPEQEPFTEHPRSAFKPWGKSGCSDRFRDTDTYQQSTVESWGEEENPRINPAVQQAMVLGIPSLAETAKFRANPLLPAERERDYEEGNLLLDTRRYRKLRMPDPSELARRDLHERRMKERLEEIERSIRRHGAAPARMTTRPRAVLSDVNKSVMESSSDHEDILAKEKKVRENLEGLKAEKEKEEKAQRERLARLKRREHESYEPLLTIALGKDKHLPAQERIPNQKEILQPARAQPPAKPPKAPRIQSSVTPVQTTTVEKLVETFSEIRIRTCIYPQPGPKDPFPDQWKSSVKTDEQFGSVPHLCSCRLSAESLGKSDIQQILKELDFRLVDRLKGCCNAIFRDWDDVLTRCGNTLPPAELDNLMLRWYPQTGALGFFCEAHCELLDAHKICPLCNEFYHLGTKDFAICRGTTGSKTHLYHLDCRKRMNLTPRCPHCMADRTSAIEEWFAGKEIKRDRPPFIDYNGLFTEMEYRSIEIPGVSNSLSDIFEGFVSDSDVAELGSVADRNGHPEGIDMLKLSSHVRDLKLWAILDARQRSLPILDIRFDDGGTLIHRAAARGKVAAAVILCLAGINLHVKNSDSETALMVAVKTKHYDVVYALLNLDADINTRDAEGRTVLHVAALERSVPLMQFLLEEGINSLIKDNYGFAAPFYTVLWMTEMDFYDLIMSMPPESQFLQDYDGWSMLHWIAFLQRNELVKYYQDNEVPFMRDKWGDTPTHAAVRVGNPEFIKLLLTARPPLKVTRKNHAGEDPYSLAKKLGKKKIISLMERFMSEELEVESNRRNVQPPPFVPIGECCSDVTKGKNGVPVPCYNFVNGNTFSHELLYLRISVPPILHQELPRQQRVWGDACTWEGPHTTCIEAGCKCSTNNNSCDRKHYCSGICAVLENHLNTDMVDGCFVPGERHTGQPVISLFSKGKPGLTEPLRSALEERLLAKSEYANPGLVDSLMYVLDMVQAAYPPYSENGRRRRSRSVGTRSRTVHRTRCKSLARLPVPVRGKQKGVEKKKPVPSVNVEDSTRRKFRPNAVDLFDELEQCDVSEFLEAAMTWFEIRHPLQRWDLSFHYPLAPRRHPRKRQSSIQQIPKYSPRNLRPLRHDDSSSDDDSFIVPVLPRRTRLGAAAPPEEDGSDMELDPDMIFALTECSVKCMCSMACPFRMFQWPTRVRVALMYDSPLVGWGVIALAKIVPGQYIMEYTGEINYGDMYFNDTYMYGLTIGENWSVDAKRAGSYARLFNHSCRPNAKTVEVLGHGMDVPRMCSFALRTIRPCQPVTLDYGAEWWKIKSHNEGMKCQCGEATCRFSKGGCSCDDPECLSGTSKKGKGKSDRAN